MVAPLKQLSLRPDRLTSGHRACAGCGFPIALKMVLMSTEDPVVVANATGCAEACTSIFPYTAWDVPWIHSAFENAAATISGVEAALANRHPQTQAVRCEQASSAAEYRQLTTATRQRKGGKNNEGCPNGADPTHKL